jgi:DNA-directed RNA polymerase specialized sigma subunit
VLDTRRDVITVLVRYTDWWQPATSSILVAGAARRSNEFSDGIRDGLLDSLDERAELRRRMAHLTERDRRVLFLWYVRELEVSEIARFLKLSRRQCFRIRASAIDRLVEQGEAEADGTPDARSAA